ncbi:MAG: hypothetical protein EXR69_15555 [Myxococcales bacterium]|nr:hypothetical protein [Myxococcales bacterium]
MSRIADLWGLTSTDLEVAAGLPTWDAHPLGDAVGLAATRVLQRVLPNTEQWTRWASREEVDRELASVLGAWGAARRYTPWDGDTSDAAFARALVQGPMAPLVERRGEAFVVDVRVLAGLDRHPGTVPLGCVVTFEFVHAGADSDSKARTPAMVSIELEDGTIRRPGEGEAWEVARLIGAAGMQTWLAIGPHLVHTHTLAGGALATAAVTALGVDHPVRRLLAPHIAGTLRANDWLGKTVWGPYGTIQAVYSFPWSSVQTLIARAIAQLDRVRFDLPLDLERRGMTEASAAGDYPYGADGLLVWNAIHLYVREYLCVYYPDDAAVLADAEVQAFAALHQRLAPGLSAATLNSFARGLTAQIFAVTVHHKMVGGISLELLTHPYFLPHRVGPGETVEQVVPFREETEANLAATVGMISEGGGLTDDWASLALDEAGRAVMRAFQDDLRAVGEHIDARNLRRLVPFSHLRPSELGASVSG